MILNDPFKANDAIRNPLMEADFIDLDGDI